MAGYDLKKLNRKQLLELLLRQTEKVEALENQVSELEKQLEDKTHVQQEIGSIAEASLKLNGVFEAAEAAAAQYLENIRALSGDQEEQEKSLELLIRKRAKDVIDGIEKQCAEREAEAAKKIQIANEKIAEANSKILEARTVIENYKNAAKEELAAPEEEPVTDVNEPDKSIEPRDVLDDFFAGVIRK